MWTKVDAYNGNSTRAEIAAGLLALVSEGPIHIGSDSESFVDKANIMIHNCINNIDNRNWGLCSDGDLWAHFEKAVKAKGPLAVKVQ